MSRYDDVRDTLVADAKSWLITGVAGFIGSNLLETLLGLGQTVVGLDNFATGHERNLEEVKRVVGRKDWDRFTFIDGDIRSLESCRAAVKGIDHVLHQAALGSVPRSIDDPITTNQANIDGFLNMLVAARDEGVRSFTYAGSSSTYGDHPALPKREENIGNPLSPYAVTKYVDELYAEVFARTYGFESIGLRYFNVFGKRQDPGGAYAAVIPKWTASMINGDTVHINGDGKTSRDFCFVDNTVQVNILAAVAPESAKNEVYNVAVGDRTTLNELYAAIKMSLQRNGIDVVSNPVHRDFRVGDVRHSQADIRKAQEALGYVPEYRILDGIDKAMPWYIEFFNQAGVSGESS